MPIIAFPEAREVSELGGTKGEHTEGSRRAGSRTGKEVANGRGAISSAREEFAPLTELVGDGQGPDASYELVGVVGSGHQITVDTDDVRGGIEEEVLRRPIDMPYAVISSMKAPPTCSGELEPGSNASI